MSEPNERYAVRLSTGQWYQGRDENNEAQWTRVPRWAQVFEDKAELAKVLEWLEESDHEYTLMRVK